MDNGSRIHGSIKEWYRETVENLRKIDAPMADAVSAIYDFATDRWSGPFPTKEQTEAVNRYFANSYCGWVEPTSESQRETLVSHRSIAGKRLVIKLINFLDGRLLEKAGKAVSGIAADPGYHMPVRRGLGL